MLQKPELRAGLMALLALMQTFTFFYFFISQINSGIADFHMLMMVVNDNFLEGQQGDYRIIKVSLVRYHYFV